ncbi:Tetratricopeptide repeat protein 1 [Bienertia sinuspersici]
MSRVMATYQDCEKIKKEPRYLLIEKDNFDPEDIGCLLSYIDDLDNPKELTDHIKEFKEDGNSFFKKGDIDSALEKYGFAGIFLTCLALKMEEDREKASAAMELGILEFAVSDLELAYVIDPSNQEEMEDLSENPEVDMRDAVLEVELSPRVGTVLNPTQFKVGGATTTKLASVVKEEPKEETHEMIEDVILKEVEKSNAAKGRVVVEKPKDVEMNDADCSRKCGKGRDLMESKHRFHNRRHQGSFLNISKRDYSKLTQGKTLQYYNAKSS